jgi:hypothetical protein
MSWTWFAEDVDDEGRPVLYDYTQPESPQPLYPEIHLSISSEEGPFFTLYSRNYEDLLPDLRVLSNRDAFAPCVNEGSFVTAYPWYYQVRVVIPSNGDSHPLLLATPIFDDVTIFWRPAGDPIRFLEASLE